MTNPDVCPHILVIDDEPQVLSAIEDLLEDEYVVDTTSSFEQAMEHISKGDLAVILSDQRMPEFTGDQILTQANELCDASRVLVTGYADLEAVTSAVNNGKIFAYIGKPWDPAAFRATVRQAVEYHELLRAIERERGLLHALMDNTPDAVYFKDAEGRYIRANAPLARSFGVADVKGIIGKRASDFVSGEALAAIEADDEAVLRTGKPQLVERLLTHHGEQRWYSISKAPVRYRDTKSGGLVAIGRDITDRKRAEEAVQMVNRIAIRIGERTDVESATRLALEEVCQHYGWAHGQTWVPRAGAQQSLRLGSVWHDGDPRIEAFVDLSRGYSFAYGQAMPGRAWQSRRYQWVSDVTAAAPEYLVDAHTFVEAGFKAAVAMPVFAGETLSAVLMFFMRDAHREHEQRAEAIAACVAPLGYFLERIKTETALRETDERLNLALGSGGVGTWTYRHQEQRMEVGERMAMLLGLAPTAFSEPLAEFEKRLHPADRIILKDAIATCLERAVQGREEHEFEVEFRVLGKDRATRVLSAHGKAYREGNGMLSLIGAATDVTEIRSLADFSAENPFPVFRIRADGAVQEANQAARALLQIPEHGAREGVRAQWRALVSRLLAQGGRDSVEERSGDEVVRLTFVPVPAKGYVNVYGEDITEQKRSEATLRQVQKMRAVGELTGGVAHDFNNRLTVILGNLELLERRLGDNELARKLLAGAREGAEGGAKLTRQLLAFSRSQVLETETVDVNELVRHVQELITRAIGENIRARLVLTEEPWPVSIDRNQLEDVLINLSVNARDAMPGGGELRFETSNWRGAEGALAAKPWLPAGDYLLLAVSDNGSGMPAEVKERIFEPFFTTKEKGKGTGLGLAMVYGFVKQSGGYVEVESEEGRGTRFEIYLPRVNAKTHPHVAPQDGSAQNGDRSGKILVAEDDPAVRLVAVTLLEDMGYEVVEAQDGHSALRALEGDEDIDLLFTDMVMPGGMTGLELSRAARERRPELPVVYASGYTEQGPFAGENEGREVYWITKPYDGATLERKISDALQAGRG